MQGGVHQLEAVDPGVGHVGEDLVEDRVNVVAGLRGGVDPGMGADDDAFVEHRLRRSSLVSDHAGGKRQGRGCQELAARQDSGRSAGDLAGSSRQSD